MFFIALFTIGKTRKQSKCPWTEEWVKKMWYIYTKEYYSAIKKNEIMKNANEIICSNIDKSRDCHSEGSKSGRERQINEYAI